MKNDLPNNIEAEKAVISSIIKASNQFQAIDDISRILNSDDFYRYPNREIYTAILFMFSEHKSIDEITLTEYLKNAGKLDKIGGIAYITEIANYIPSAANLKEYAQIVRDTAVRRDVIKAGELIQDIGYSSDNIDDAVEQAEKIIFNISKSHRHTSKIIEPQELMLETIQEIEKQYENKNTGGLSGINTGFRDLNTITGGFQKSDFIVLGARPAMGKTALALSIALRVAKKNIPVAVFSLEMSRQQLGKRLISAMSCINSSKISSGQITENEWTKILVQCDKLSKFPLYIDDTAEMSVMELRSKARQLKHEKDIQLMIIDYLQLLSSDRKRDSKVQEVSDISRQLKILAKELNIPIIALAQLSRKVEERQDKRPMLSDLRESGAIEQDADIVAFLYRDSYYNKDCKEKNLSNVIITKHRNGATGIVDLYYHFDFCYFNDCLQSSIHQ